MSFLWFGTSYPSSSSFFARLSWLKVFTNRLHPQQCGCGIRVPTNLMLRLHRFAAPVSAPILYCLFANSSAKPIKYLRIAVRMRHKTFDKFNTTSASVRVLIWIQYFPYLRIVFKAVAKWLRQKVLMLHFWLWLLMWISILFAEYIFAKLLLVLTKLIKYLSWMGHKDYEDSDIYSD